MLTASRIALDEVRGTSVFKAVSMLQRCVVLELIQHHVGDFSVAQRNELLELAKQACFRQHDEIMISDALNFRCGLLSALQDSVNMPEYFTHEEWDVLLSDDIDMNDKIDIACKRLVKLGICFPNEPSMIRLTSFCLLLHMACEGCLQLSVERKHGALKHITKQLKKSLSLADSDSDLPNNLPEDPDEFRMLWPELWRKAYEDDCPIPCQLNVDALMTIDETFSRKDLCRSDDAPPPPPGKRFGVWKCENIFTVSEDDPLLQPQLIWAWESDHEAEIAELIQEERREREQHEAATMATEDWAHQHHGEQHEAAHGEAAEDLAHQHHGEQHEAGAMATEDLASAS